MATGTGAYSNSDYSISKSAATFPATTKLLAPTLGEVKATGSNAISVAWSTVSNASGYTVQYATNSAFTTGIGTKTVSSSITSTTIDGLSADTTYYVRVMATGTGAYSNSDYSAYKSATTFSVTTKLPVAPANFKSTAQTSNSVTLTWDSQTNLTSYKLEYKKSTDQTWITWSPAPGTDAVSATVTGLAANTEYNFRLTATNDDGSETSTTNATTDPLVPPEPQTGLVVTEKTTDSISLVWGSVDSAICYEIQYCLNGGRTWIAGTKTDVPSATIEKLAADMNYTFRVRAVLSDGDVSDWSDMIVASTNSAESAIAAVKPKKVAVVTTNGNKPTLTTITLKVTKNTSAESKNTASYIITCTSDPMLKFSYSVNGDQILIKDLNPGTKYTFAVQAVHQNGNISAAYSVKATTVKYAAVKKVGAITKPSLGTVTFGWKDADKMPTGENVTYEVGIYNAKTKKYLWGADAKEFAPEVTGFDNIGTAKTATLTGLSSQTYTFAVKAIAMIDGKIFESAILKFAAAPSVFKAPKFTQPAKLDGAVGAVTLNLSAASATALPAGYAVKYEVGVLIGGQYVWGDAASAYLTGELTSTVAVGEDWTITGTDKLKKGLQIAVRAVLYDSIDDTLVAKSAVLKMTVK
jgi:chitodextrinase